MLFLLPPSETKAIGGGAMSIAQVALTFGALNPAREELYAALEKFCKSKAGKKYFKPEQLEVNLAVQEAPTMFAIDRYTGTLYDAIHGRGLKGSGTENNRMTASMFERAKEQVLIQSSLFGLIPADNRIPNYRFSATTKLPGVNLRELWGSAHEAVWPRLQNGPIIDLRSKSYAELASIPAEVESYWVEVLDANSGKALNHFNKKGKGLFVRAALESRLTDVAKIAAIAGLKAEVSGSVINLYV